MVSVVEQEQDVLTEYPSRKARWVRSKTDRTFRLARISIQECIDTKFEHSARGKVWEEANTVELPGKRS